MAEERGKIVGETVGYQIRLDSRVNATTNLIFTTSGFLLRCMTDSKRSDIFANMTHLIIDEVHEREKVTDFILIVLRDILGEYPNLKVILMSATIDSDMFSDYFGNCPVIKVPGRMFDVKVYHLAEILTVMEYKTDCMNDYMHHYKWLYVAKEENVYPGLFFHEYLAVYFQETIQLISDGKMIVDYMNSRTGRTALSIAAEQGLFTIAKMLLSKGANPNLCDYNGKTSFDYAKDNDNMDCFDLMKKFGTENVALAEEEYDSHNLGDDDLQRLTLAAYLSSLEDDSIDHDLLYYVLAMIHSNRTYEGSILVFLPGIDDIKCQKEMIETNFENSDYEIFVLHSNVSDTTAQNRVFEKMPDGIRKIILSTNIAETSITIDDVVSIAYRWIIIYSISLYRLLVNLHR